MGCGARASTHTGRIPMRHFTPPAMTSRGWTGNQLYGNMAHMKTTIDLPDDLVRRVKVRAAHRNQKLKDVVAQLLELGMAHAGDAEPVSRAPKPVRLRKRPPLTIDDIEAAIAAGRD